MSHQLSPLKTNTQLLIESILAQFDDANLASAKAREVISTRIEHALNQAMEQGAETILVDTGEVNESCVNQSGT